MNLAGVLPWIHWRGLLILCLLVLGNFFCLACPFTLPRRLDRSLAAHRAGLADVAAQQMAGRGNAGRCFSGRTRRWRCGIGRPSWTAWLAIGYFVAAFTVDSLFRDGTFCKHVCPIGQFNFVQSLVSPWEVKVRQAEACDTCRTHDCIRGRESLPGCQLHLFQPLKTGNMDCTFCLDCVHACPQDNVGILFTLPGQDLWLDPFRSGVGRFSKAARSGGVGRGAGLRGLCQRRRHGRAGRGVATRSVASLMGARFAAADHQPASLSAAPADRDPGGWSITMAAAAGRRWGRLTIGPSELAQRACCWSLGAAGFFDVAGALQLSLAHQLRHVVVRCHASGSLAGLLGFAERTPMGCELLPPGRRLAAAIAEIVCFWTSGCWRRSTRLSPGRGLRPEPRPAAAPNRHPLGAVDHPAVRGRRLDRLPADANARHDAGGGMNTSVAEASAANQATDLAEVRP